MKKSTKIEYKTLEFLTESQKCIFCNTTEMNEMKYGPVYAYKNIVTHYYCLLLSSNMEQNGRDTEGILGFLPGDITKEVRRGLKLYCTYCRSNGATLGCAIGRCKVVFHLPCGMKHGTLHQFFREFKSFCNQHRPVQKISEKILAESAKGAVCGICFDKVIPRPIHETLWAPCCQKSAFFHRDCVQTLATSAGYFFKCPLCNNVEIFTQAMKEFGIFIPEQDASWERVPQAYQDLLVRHDTCDSKSCICPSGRKTNVSGTRWELILCKFCGSQGVHIGCGRLKWKCPEFECETCCGDNDSSHSQEGNWGDRHRLSGRDRSETTPPRTQPHRVRARERSPSESSEDSAPLITNRRQKVRSPPAVPREKTPPQSYNKSNHDRSNKSSEETKSHKSASRAIVIDDSDDDLEVVRETESGCLKIIPGSQAGSTIPVVPVVRSVQKRVRAVGDVQVIPAEIVDITRHAGGVKKPRLPSPPPIKEVVYSMPPLPQPTPQPSTSGYSAPSTSYVLVDQATLRQSGLPPNSLVYRSTQPVSTMPQPPMPIPVQQLGHACHADAKHPDLCEYGSGGRNHHGSVHLPHSKKKAPRTAKRDSVGRRGRRSGNRGCDYNRLSPRVVLSPLKCRLSDGHFEIICTRRNLGFGSLKRRLPLPSIPAKKIKTQKKPNSPSKTKRRKRKVIEVDSTDEPKLKKKKITNKIPEMKIETTNSVQPKFTSLEKYFNSLNIHQPSVVQSVTDKQLKRRSKANTVKGTKKSPNSMSKFLKEEWKFKTVDSYFKRSDKTAELVNEKSDTETGSILFPQNSDTVSKASIVKSIVDEIIDAIFYKENADKNNSPCSDFQRPEESGNSSESSLSEEAPCKKDEMSSGTPSKIDVPVTEEAVHGTSSDIKVTIVKGLFDNPPSCTPSTVARETSDASTHLDSNTCTNRSSFVSSMLTDDDKLSRAAEELHQNQTTSETSSSISDSPKLQKSSREAALQNGLQKDINTYDNLESIQIKETNKFKNSTQGFFPKIKLFQRQHPKKRLLKSYLKRNQKSAKEIPDQSKNSKLSQAPKRVQKLGQVENFKEELKCDQESRNRLSAIDSYFMQTRKDVFNIDTNQISNQNFTGQSSVNFNIEKDQTDEDLQTIPLMSENSNKSNSHKFGSPEKRPLAELQLHYIPFQKLV